MLCHDRDDDRWIFRSLAFVDRGCIGWHQRVEFPKGEGHCAPVEINGKLAFVEIYILNHADVAANAKATDIAFEQMLARWQAGDYTMDTKRWGTGDKKKAMNENFAKFNRMLPKLPGNTAVERLSAMDRMFRKSNTVGEWTRLMDAAGILVATHLPSRTA